MADTWRVVVRKIWDDAHLFQGVRLVAWFDQPKEAERVAALLNADEADGGTDG